MFTCRLSDGSFPGAISLVTRRDIAGGSTESAHGGISASASVHILGDAEVRHLWLKIGVQQNVAGLQVAMNNGFLVLPVQINQALCNTH